MTPWTPEEVSRHNKAAGANPKHAQLWASVANSTLERTGDDVAAIRAANSVIKHMNEMAKTNKPVYHSESRSAPPAKVKGHSESRSAPPARKSALGAPGLKRRR